MEYYSLITGASSGLGREIAITLSQTQNVVLLGRNLEELKNTANLCNTNTKHMIVSFDLNNISELSNFITTFISTNNILIDKFVHSAGIMEMSFALEFNHKNLLRVMNINVYSAMSIISTLIKKKLNNKALKNIILISSIAAKHNYKGSCYYNMTKNALDSFTATASKELAPAIRINNIAPGLIRTEGTENILATKKLSPLLGEGTPSDIANMVEFLLSEKSRWITGETIVVDGGYNI